MSRKEREARVVGDEIHFRLLVTSEHDDTFEYPGRGFPGEASQLKAMTVKVDGMQIYADAKLKTVWTSVGHSSENRF
jgi:hypothetical protein